MPAGSRGRTSRSRRRSASGPEPPARRVTRPIAAAHRQARARPASRRSPRPRPTAIHTGPDSRERRQARAAPARARRSARGIAGAVRGLPGDRDHRERIAAATDRDGDGSRRTASENARPSGSVSNSGRQPEQRSRALRPRARRAARRSRSACRPSSTTGAGRPGAVTVTVPGNSIPNGCVIGRSILACSISTRDGSDMQWRRRCPARG